MEFNYIIITGYNDLDHLLPFIFEASKKENTIHNIYLFGASRRNLKVEDLLGLCERDNVRVIRCFTNKLNESLSHLFFSLESLVNNTLLRKIFITFKNKFLDRDIGKISFLSNRNRVFISGREDLPKGLIQSLDISKEDVFLFPHGFELLINKLVTTDRLFLDSEEKQVHKESYMFKITSDIYTKNSDLVLGSLRFSKDWINFKLSKTESFKWNSKKRLKIAIIDPKDTVNTFRDEVWRSCQLITMLDDACVAVANRGTEVPASIPGSLKDNANFRWVEASIATSAVIDWADIVIHNGTTLHAECIELGKPVMFPRYFAVNYSYCEEYNSAIVLKTRDDLYNELVAARSNVQKYKEDYKLKYNENLDRYAQDFYRTNDTFEKYYSAIMEKVNG